MHLLVINNDNLLLYLRQNTGFGDGMYSVISGHVDGNESVTTAMIREAKEEAGIDIKRADLEITYVMHRKTPNQEVIDYFMKVTKWQNKIQNLEPTKCKELKFFNINDLPDNMIPYVKVAIEHSLQGIKFSEFGWD
ncbi:NUDIX hydrolase [Candidatus Trichorickettsia mobilis]|uniref:NUDIX hydrolase n=1 Tax=Candidatus Trichorickettsia mobilis TaxID=1346319 RepID=UPI00292E7660|nr:NUDIX domain-containing protein [Candidatus Trichorickettsia mobilis]